MTPKFESRRIGGVKIFEVRGTFSRPWIQSLRGQMSRSLEKERIPGLLFNVREIEKMDETAAEAVLKFLREKEKGAILGHNLPAYFIAEHMNPNESIPIFENGREAVEYFSREFAKPTRGLPLERRRLPRVRTALPVEFELEQAGDTFVFEAVVTNLSEGGLFAYFLDAATEELANRLLNPFDLKMVNVRLYLGRDKFVEMEGKVLRTNSEYSSNQGLALAFYNIRPADAEMIRRFIEEQGKNVTQARRKK